jgi:hypothetical protein
MLLECFSQVGWRAKYSGFCGVPVSNSGADGLSNRKDRISSSRALVCVSFSALWREASVVVVSVQERDVGVPVGYK